MMRRLTDGRIRSQTRLSLIALAAFALAIQPTPAQVIEPPFDAHWTLIDLGAIDGLPAPYGGMTFRFDSPDTLLVGGEAAYAAGALYAVPVLRDSAGHIFGFGSAEFHADADYVDGGVGYGPADVLFASRWSLNEIGQTMPGSAATDRVAGLDALGVIPSPGGLGFVPTGFDGAGMLKIVGWPDGNWYTLGLASDGTGTFDITSATMETSLDYEPEGFFYVPAGSPGFADFTSVVVAEFGGGVAAYDVDAGGNPVPATRRPFISGLSSAEGATVDPVTGDFLFSLYGDYLMSERILVARRDGQPADEVCDGLDNDLDNEIDEDFAYLGEACSAGQGICETEGVIVCTADGSATECDAVPGIPEFEDCANGEDDDCDGLVDGDDEECFGGTCHDADDDGFGAPGDPSCPGGEASDCNDANADVRPGGLDLPGNSHDEDCSGEAVCDPCRGWGNHGRYVACVSQAAGRLLTEGLIDGKQASRLVVEASRSRVGQKGFDCESSSDD